MCNAKRERHARHGTISVRGRGRRRISSMPARDDHRTFNDKLFLFGRHFGMIRGGHIDLAYSVRWRLANGADLANWMIPANGEGHGRRHGSCAGVKRSQCHGRYAKACRSSSIVALAVTARLSSTWYHRPCGFFHRQARQRRHDTDRARDGVSLERIKANTEANFKWPRTQDQGGLN